jgi:hypothetical protein
MTFAQVLVDSIAAVWTTAPVYWGIPERVAKPYVVALIVNPAEQAPVLCEDQGDSGELLIQFSGVAETDQGAYNMLESLKAYVQTLGGLIAYDGNAYRIMANTTDGVRQFDAGIGTWQCLFESTLAWKRV